MHGAPVQCTKGKCPKAFHVTCARDGHEQGLVYKILQEVEKEVVLLDQNDRPGTYQNPTESLPNMTSDDPIAFEPVVDAISATEMSLDVTHASSGSPNIDGSRVLKVIKKLEVQVLCPQHNPVCHSFLNISFYLIFTFLGTSCSQKSK